MLSLWLPDPILRIIILPLLLAICSGVGWLSLSPIGQRIYRDGLERWIVYTLAGTILISWIGVVLAFVGLFRIWLLAPLLTGTAVLLRKAVRWPGSTEPAKSGSVPQEQQGQRSAPAYANVPAVLLLVAAGWLYARPAESFLLTDDSAVYTIAGIVLARDGTLYYEPDEVFDFVGDASVGESVPSALEYTYQFSFLQNSGPVLTRHTGPFFRWPVVGGHLEIGFLALPKVWAALCVWLASQAYAIWAVPFFGVLGLGLLYVLARRLFAWQVALAATALLMVSFPQLWFARFPLSEMHTQVVLLGGLVAAQGLGQFSDRRTMWTMGILAGASLGLLGCLRFESPLLMVVLLPLLWQSLAQHPSPFRARLALVGSASFFWLFSMGASVFTAPFYFLTRSITVLSPRVVQILLIAVLLAMGALLLLWRAERSAAGGMRVALRLAERVVGPIITLLWGLWLLHAVLALAGVDTRETLVTWLRDYWGLVPLILALLGAAALLSRLHTSPDLMVQMAPLLGIAGAFLLVYAIHPMVTMVHPWAIRRTVPFIGPTLALLIAALPATAASLATRWLPTAPKWATRLAAGACWTGVILSIALVGRFSLPFVSHTERQGMWQGLVALDAALPDRAVLLLDDGQVGKRLGPAMELAFGHPSYPLRNSWTLDPNSPVVDRLVASALDQHRPVYFVYADNMPSWRPTQWQLESKGMVAFTTTTVQSALDAPDANSIADQTLSLDLYEVTPLEPAATATSVMTARDVPIAAGSYPYLISGFHELENGGQDPFRWTGSSAEIALPWPAPAGEPIRNLCLELDTWGWRPADQPPPSLTVKVEGQTVYTGIVEPARGRYQLSMNALDVINADRNDLQITIECSGWTPPAEGGDQPPRELGIMLYGARVTAHALCPCGDEGLYAAEQDLEHAGYRWTEPSAEVRFPWPEQGDAPIQELCLTVDLSAWRPEGLAAPQVRILAEQTLLYAGALDPSLGRQQLLLSGQEILNVDQPELEIQIVCTSWKPAEQAGSSDARELGLMLYGLSVSENGACP